MHADVSFVNCCIDMLNGFGAMTMKLAFGMVHMFPGAMQRFERVLDPRMGWWNRGRRSNWESHG